MTTVRIQTTEPLPEYKFIGSIEPYTKLESSVSRIEIYECAGIGVALIGAQGLQQFFIPNRRLLVEIE